MKKFVIGLILTFIIILIGYIPNFKSVNENVEKQTSYKYSIFDYYDIIGHALGGINNKSYGNCLECLEEGYKKGIRLLEADFLFTSDDELILNHYWNKKIMDKNGFLNHKIFNQYTPLNLSILLDKMIEYQDIYIIIDTKEDIYEKSVFDVYKKIIDEVIKKDESLLDRFIPQYYSYEMYKEINDLYDFKYDIVTLYKWENINYNEIIDFSINENIDVITMPKGNFNPKIFTKDNWKNLRDHNIKIYVHTINSKEEFDILKVNGVDGIYSDFLN